MSNEIQLSEYSQPIADLDEGYSLTSDFVY